jgi:mannose-6-phosphate isomerase-like protein (cupin superfamily)
MEKSKTEFRAHSQNPKFSIYTRIYARRCTAGAAQPGKSSLGGSMSIIFPDPKHSIHVHGHQAEVVGSTSAKVKLLVDSNATGGALSTVQVTLEKDADGARPHRHDHSAEMFYVLDGSVQVLSGTEIVKVERGDVIVVPPRLPHAFAVARSIGADLLIVIAPGIERFEYFRKLTRSRRKNRLSRLSPYPVVFGPETAFHSKVLREVAYADDQTNHGGTATASQ